MAREAAVSPATVSRVLSGAKAVSADLERRVRAAVERLGYRPNPAAQGLLRGATHTIGMVVPDLSNPYFAEVLKGVTAAAEAADFRTLVSDTGENAGAEYAAALELSRWTDGVVLSSPRMTDEDLAALADRAPRLVCVNRLLPGRNVPAVVVDFEAGMAALCRHLRELGHRRVAYLRGPPRAWSERARQRALRAAAGPGFEVVQVACGSGDTDGYRAADAALAAGATAVVAFSDHVALGVLARLDELGVGVPAEVSLTGFDDTSLSPAGHPAADDRPRPQAGPRPAGLGVAHRAGPRRRHGRPGPRRPGLHRAARALIRLIRRGAAPPPRAAPPGPARSAAGGRCRAGRSR
ncbi:LacI family DNA-binding transcriptional regulator [Actinomadura madurae]|uniref:LacI family DNA-binding transcriptional regulator n=1 Tax=Actinomadura madurae TaxID=1993 RepID=UPI0020D25063|nr:LacI family DNA-binding transcriptional regulator [Actinomadura madurae]MCP9983128.1 LacI family transcriptional regulator [Actinomadura madurae]